MTEKATLTKMDAQVILDYIQQLEEGEGDYTPRVGRVIVKLADIADGQ
jgi:hypothetical protein